MIDTSITLNQLNISNKGNLSENLEIEYIELTKNYLIARMPVNKKTKQQLGMLNGGAAAALAETVGSMAAYCSIDRKKYFCLGLNLQISHLKPATSGYVYGKASPIHLGQTTHVWNIETTNEQGQKINTATLTMSVREISEEQKTIFEKLEEIMKK